MKHLLRMQHYTPEKRDVQRKTGIGMNGSVLVFPTDAMHTGSLSAESDNHLPVWLNLPKIKSRLCKVSSCQVVMAI